MEEEIERCACRHQQMWSKDATNVLVSSLTLHVHIAVASKVYLQLTGYVICRQVGQAAIQPLQATMCTCHRSVELHAEEVEEQESARLTFFGRINM